MLQSGHGCGYTSIVFAARGREASAQGRWMPPCHWHPLNSVRMPFVKRELKLLTAKASMHMNTRAERRLQEIPSNRRSLLGGMA